MARAVAMLQGARGDLDRIGLRQGVSL
jgi:hypothetical protein